MKKHLFCRALLFMSFNFVFFNSFALQNTPPLGDLVDPIAVRVEGSSDNAYPGQGSHFVNPLAFTFLVIALATVKAGTEVYALGSWCVQIPYKGLSSLGTTLNQRDFKDLNEMFAPKK